MAAPRRAPNWSMAAPTVRRRLATRLCCLRARRRQLSRATVSAAPNLPARKVQARSFSMMACKILRWPRISHWPSSMHGAGSAMRAPLDAQLARTDAMLVVGEGNAADGVAARLRARSRPIFQARLVPDKAAVSALRAQNVLAFAGIG